jgi:two-component system sensor histidine kinase PhoQ
MIIEDDGPGIQESQREMVFNRGQRVDTLRPGQGIGLSVVRELVYQYQGEIIVGVSPLGGTKMEIIFPHQHLSQEID